MFSRLKKDHKREANKGKESQTIENTKAEATTKAETKDKTEVEIVDKTEVETEDKTEVEIEAEIKAKEKEEITDRSIKKKKANDHKPSSTETTVQTLRKKK